MTNGFRRPPPGHIVRVEAMAVEAGAAVFASAMWIAGWSVGISVVWSAAAAALGIEHGTSICSYDGDFARFGGLRWVHPDRQL